MNLRWVHAVLILLSAALAVLFGVWCLGLYSREDGVASLLAAVVAFAVSFGLVVYDRGFCARRGRSDEAHPGRLASARRLVATAVAC